MGAWASRLGTHAVTRNRTRCLSQLQQDCKINAEIGAITCTIVHALVIVDVVDLSPVITVLYYGNSTFTKSQTHGFE